jgi:predicted RNase H-like nuclease
VTIFIGIDLAWRSERNNTGIAVLCGDRGGAQLIRVSSSICKIATVREFVENHAGASTVIAIDAPLIIENTVGQRPCETAVGREYGSREASCHTSNLRLYPGAASVALARELVLAGYVHAPSADAASKNMVLEVYPHAGLVELFDLPKSLKYKKGTLAQKCSGLRVLAEHLTQLAQATPVLLKTPYLADLLTRDLKSLKGRDLKAHEDSMDAVFCAYLAYYFWYWRLARNRVFGDLDTGYIVNPCSCQRDIANSRSTPIRRGSSTV